MKTVNKVFVALGAGLAVGAATGILMAPKKGSETRRLLRRKGVRLVEDLKDGIKNGIEEKQNQFTNLKEDIRDKVAGVNKKLHELS